MEPLERSDPKRVGGITLHRRLGSGGMGRVFFGVTDDHEPVAVKLIREDLVGRREVRARFAREVDALRTVQGPQVAALIDAAAEDEERPWLAVEYIRGLPLNRYVEQRGPLDEQDAATLGALLANALRDIHAAGLLHRDFKPGNVLLGRDGPKVIDLGLVTFTEGPTDLTGTGDTLGTPVCMPPEQIVTPKELTPAADVYALGATLLFALTGRYPYDAPTVPALFMKINDARVAPDLTGVPPRFTPLLSAMLAHDPAARPTVPEVYAALLEPVTAGELTLSLATRRLAVATYVAPDDDLEDLIPPPRPRPRPVAEMVRPGTVVAGIADDLRGAYAAGAVL